MTVEEALSTVEEILDYISLNKTQETVLRQIWEGLSYQEIAKQTGYNEGYVRSVGSKLFQMIADTLGEKVSKQNLRLVLKRYVKRRGGITEPLLPAGLPAWSGPAHRSTYQDWGEAIDVSTFSGRDRELATLRQWIVNDRCRLVGLLGEDGIGKAALSVRFAQMAQHEFECIVWRSLRYPPPLTDLLAGLIESLSQHQETLPSLPENLGDRLSAFIQSLRNSRSLIVLSNFQTVQIGSSSSSSLINCEDYGELLNRVGETEHQSCLVITSPQKPREIAILQGDTAPVRTLLLSGLTPAACQSILHLKGLSSDSENIHQLIRHCQGNPLQLKLTATLIQDSFAGNIAHYLQTISTEPGHTRATAEQEIASDSRRSRE